jgi:hypothetical protein
VTSDLEEAAMQYYQARANVVGLRMDVIEDYKIRVSTVEDERKEGAVLQKFQLESFEAVREESRNWY